MPNEFYAHDQDKLHEFLADFAGCRVEAKFGQGEAPRSFAMIQKNHIIGVRQQITINPILIRYKSSYSLVLRSYIEESIDTIHSDTHSSAAHLGDAACAPSIPILLTLAPIRCVRRPPSQCLRKIKSAIRVSFPGARAETTRSDDKCDCAFVSMKSWRPGTGAAILTLLTIEPERQKTAHLAESIRASTIVKPPPFAMSGLMSTSSSQSAPANQAEKSARSCAKARMSSAGAPR